MAKKQDNQETPQPDLPGAAMPEPPPEEKKVSMLPKGSKISVDRKLFFKLATTLILLNPNQSMAHAARRQIGQMLGAKTYQEECDFWDAIKAEIAEEQRKAQEVPA